MTGQKAIQYLNNEAVSLLGRLNQVTPFTMSMPMVWAAGISDEAMRSITDHMSNGIQELKGRIHSFISSLNDNEETPARQVQAKFSLLKLRFNDILDQFDIFADVLSQRAEQKTGIWVAGLDSLSADALRLQHQLFKTPPVICFLERGHGAAIRKARTRLPGGDPSPVGIIQVPRERMVGSGIASSIVHEAGHQGAALLQLVESLREALRLRGKEDKEHELAWSLYHLWISEIIADVWAMAHLGIGATLGLMGVVSLPEYFMFRIRTDDPHPFPWIRVMISIKTGKYLFPHPQWDEYEKLWKLLFPTHRLDEKRKKIIAQLEQVMPALVKLIVHHSNQKMDGHELKDLFPIASRQPAKLQEYFKQWEMNPTDMLKARPGLVFAVIGQAKADQQINERQETHLLEKMLNRWAFMSSENRTHKDSIEITNELNAFIKN